MMMRKGVLAVWFGCLFLPAAALAQPTETGESGLISIPTTRTVDAGKVQFGYYYRWEIDNDKRFEVATGQLRNTTLRAHEFSLGVGIYDGIEISAQVPYVNFDTEDLTGNLKERIRAHKLGNPRVTPKIRFFKEDESAMPFSLALQGSVYIPTGGHALPEQLDRNSSFNGDKVGGEVMAIADKNLFTLPGDAPVVLTLNVGGLFPSHTDVFRLDRQTEPVFSQLRRKQFPEVHLRDAVIQYGGGLSVPLWKNHIGELDMLAEYRGNTGTIEEIDEYQAIQPGIRYMLINGWAVAGGVDFGLSNSISKYNGVVGISYTGPQPPPPPPPVKEKIVYRDRVIQVEKVTFSDVTFEFDKAKLTDVGKGRVYLIAQKLKEGKNVKVEIQGHTDYIGTEDYNKKLGQSRADAVKDELGRLGVDASRISTTSFGEEKPLIDKQTPWARAVNRRVEFVILGEPEVTTKTTELPAGSEPPAAPEPAAEPAP
jgi:OOP family OmpA-OmpF porin